MITTSKWLVRPSWHQVQTQSNSSHTKANVQCRLQYMSEHTELHQISIKFSDSTVTAVLATAQQGKGCRLDYQTSKPLRNFCLSPKTNTMYPQVPNLDELLPPLTDVSIHPEGQAKRYHVAPWHCCCHMNSFGNSGKLRKENCL